MAFEKSDLSLDRANCAISQLLGGILQALALTDFIHCLDHQLFFLQVKTSVTAIVETKEFNNPGCIRSNNNILVLVSVLINFWLETADITYQH